MDTVGKKIWQKIIANSAFPVTVPRVSRLFNREAHSQLKETCREVRASISRVVDKHSPEVAQQYLDYLGLRLKILKGEYTAEDLFYFHSLRTTVHSSVGAYGNYQLIMHVPEDILGQAREFYRQATEASATDKSDNVETPRPTP